MYRTIAITIMSKNKLSNFNSNELLGELKSRGFNTSLVFSVYDVEFIVDQYNHNLDEGSDNYINIDESKMRDIVMNCFDTDWYSEQMMNDINSAILKIN